MSKVSAKKVENTKVGLKMLLEKMTSNSDSFVDLIVRSKPEVFEEAPGEGDQTTIDPFALVKIMTEELNLQYKIFKAGLEVGKAKTEAPKADVKETRARSNVLSFGDFDGDDDGDRGPLQ